MEFEVLKQSRLKKHILIIIGVVLILTTVILTFTRAKYRVTQSIPLVNGTINYSPGDIIISAYFNDKLLETFPIKDSGYVVESVTCDNDATATFDEDAWEITVTNLVTKGTKCDVTFKKYEPTAAETILANSTVNEGTPDFSKTAQASCNNTSTCETTNEVYKAEDNLGTSYYFRGAVTNNYIKFAGYYWRIIRINGDGSIRIIYDGTSAHANGELSKDRWIGESAYNSADRVYNTSVGVGYTYQIYSQRPSRKNSGTASTIKGVLDNWYSTNIANKGYDDKVVSTPGFCNDRNTRNGDSWESSGTEFYYAAYERLVTNKTPTLKCSNNNDLYTTKVGLITADEVVYAGGHCSQDNSSYYLHIGNGYWTNSPYFADSMGWAYVFYVSSGGTISLAGVIATNNIRPVINLSADVTLTGTGTMSDPYVVEGA